MIDVCAVDDKNVEAGGEQGCGELGSCSEGGVRCHVAGEDMHIGDAILSETFLNLSRCSCEADDSV